MQNHGIGKALISDLGDGWQAFPDEETLMAANERVKREAEISNGALEYLVYINPQLDGRQKIFDRFITGSCGVKLWISLYSKEYGFERTLDVLRLAAQYDKAVLIHTFDRTDPIPEGTVGISDVAALARAVPDCRIVAAHFGGNLLNTVSHAAELPENVCLDISGTFPERGMVKKLVEAFGSRRILYGSDAFGRSFGSQLSKVFDSGISKEDMENILYANSMRVFKLTDAGKKCSLQAPAWSIPERNADNFCFVGASPYWEHRASCEELVASALANGVDTLYAADFTAVFAADKTAANRKYLETSRSFPQIHPLAAADLGNMPETLRQLDEMEGFAGVFISPYFHNYKIEYRRYARFFDLCAERNIPIWINTAWGDHRFRDKRLNARCVQECEITELASALPPNRYVFQGVVPSASLSKILPPYCRLECSRLSDSEYAPEELFDNGNPQCLCFGSDFPFRAYGCVASVLEGRV